MIGYVTLGVSDMERAKAFYTELLSDQGARLLLDMGRIAFIGKSMKAPMIAVCVRCRCHVQESHRAWCHLRR